MRAFLSAAMAVALWIPASAGAQDDDDDPMNAGTFSAFSWRSIGPAFMSGRISDIDLHPDDPATWFVCVGSGGVWRTDNAGTTWTPLFDDQDVYSIGALTIDPSNPDVLWVGTGENIGGRHAGWGDGIYRSTDGGQSWENMGLAESERISQIIVHPDDPDTVWVAAQGPLWSSGGERGLFKTVDGGETWTNVLSAGEWTGVTDVVMDPRDPDRLYAATWQRHRTVAAYVGAGPESGIHMSEDGGETWTRLEGGLPDGNMGKIGLALSPQDPDILYAAIELDRRTGGVYRSTDRGQSWEHMSDAVAGATGPHYYQELYAHPHRFDRIYLVSNVTQVSDDGGRTWRDLNLEYKHVDDHAIAFHPTDPDYVLFGSDGGIYESYDDEATWRYIANLPITQFYKVAVDDAEPFYFVYGGTQDNNSQVGPSRTLNVNGIRNFDWEVTLFGDGHQSATEPGNPDIAYAQWQQGNLMRVDRTTGEIVYIQPQPTPGEPAERFNWDAPILVSAHDPARIYHASQRLWRSDDRGDSWRPISGDLTRDIDRMLIPHMGRQWSWDAGWDLFAMSEFSTIVNIAESPIDENVLWVGTDDGLIQVTSDGGESWTEIEVGDLPGVPDNAFVNDIRADLFDVDTVYVALDNHKEGDFTPYLLRSTNRGRSWTSIAGDLPDDHIVWRVVQDHVDPELMFAGTEFGAFFTLDGGERWLEISGAPTISFRDVVIQRRENDLVGGTFGRGIYVLDDYSPLRDIDAEALEEPALLFPSRRAWWYIEERPLGGDENGWQGHGLFRAENPPFGATFTYYLAEGLQTLEEIRQEEEEPLVEEWEDTPFPGFDVIETERRETAPQVLLTIRDQNGDVVRRLSGATGAGFHRLTWDLTRPPAGAVTGPPEDPDDPPVGYMAAPGTYTAELSQRVRGETTVLAGPVTFEVERLREGALPSAGPQEVAAFWDRLARLQRSVSAANVTLGSLEGELANLQIALDRSSAVPGALDDQWQAIRTEVYEIDEALNGVRSRDQMGATPETVGSRLSFAQLGTFRSTYGPTASHIEHVGYAEAEFEDIRVRLNTLIEETIPAFQDALDAIGAPWTPGQPIPPL